MQLIRSFAQDDAAPVGLGIRVLMLTGPHGEPPLARRLAGLGGRVDCIDDPVLALQALAQEPEGFGLVVIDCDALGGIEAGHRFLSRLSAVHADQPALLISSECRQQHFPHDSFAPVLLRAPVSAVSIKVGFEHALRHRLAPRLA